MNPDVVMDAELRGQATERGDRVVVLELIFVDPGVSACLLVSRDAGIVAHARSGGEVLELGLIDELASRRGHVFARIII
jgi:hypothetical protein